MSGDPVSNFQNNPLAALPVYQAGALSYAISANGTLRSKQRPVFFTVRMSLQQARRIQKNGSAKG